MVAIPARTCEQLSRYSCRRSLVCREVWIKANTFAAVVHFFRKLINNVYVR